MSDEVKFNPNDVKEIPSDPLQPIFEKDWEVCRVETSETRIGDLELSQRDQSKEMVASGTLNSSNYGWYESENVQGPLLGGLSIPRSAEIDDEHLRDDDWYALLPHPDKENMILVDGPHCEEKFRRCEISHHSQGITDAEEVDIVEVSLEES